MPKRILIFSIVYYPRFVGGAEIALKEITDRIPPSEIDFHMVTLRADRSLPRVEKIGNITVYRLGFVGLRESKGVLRFPLSLNKYLFPFLAAIKALSLHRQNHFDAIWSSQANYAGFAALFFKNRRPNVPFILTLQEGDPLEHYRRRVGPFLFWYKRIFERAEKVQAISHFLARYAKDMGAKGSVVVIPNGVAIEHFSSRAPFSELEALKLKLQKKEDDIFLITTSRLVEKNAIKDIISSLAFLPSHIKLLVLGTGPLEEELRSQAEELGLKGRVLFIGFVPHSEMPKYLHISDIFIRPSLSEGMGNSFLEAMAADIPVIATPVGGIPDFLFDPEANPGRDPTGLFVQVENPDHIATQVKRLISDRELKERIVLSAKRMVLESYDWDLVAKRMKTEVFDPLLTTPS